MGFGGRQRVPEEEAAALVGVRVEIDVEMQLSAAVQLLDHLRHELVAAARRVPPDEDCIAKIA